MYYVIRCVRLKLPFSNLSNIIPWNANFPVDIARKGKQQRKKHV